MAGSGESAKPVLSPLHLEKLCERASHVLVSEDDDQAPAMCALGQVCPTEKISVVYGVTSTPPSWDRGRSHAPNIVQRPYILLYDYPLRRLQTAISFSADANLIDLFRATSAGEFQEFWGLPHTAEAAKLWAAIGDLFVYSLPSDIESIEFRYETPSGFYRPSARKGRLVTARNSMAASIC